MSDAFTLENTTQAVLPSVDFHAMKNEILGKDYQLSLVFVPASKMSTLNLTYRDRKCATDILSFPLTENEGEIYICPSEARKESVKFDRTYANFLAFLFIHGCTHLKGFDHGGTMEGHELRFRKLFGI